VHQGPLARRSGQALDVGNVSTAEPAEAPRRSWAAVFNTRSLTPHGVADFSPAVLPFGEWTAAASPSPVDDLNTV
jgi:hypothetical protein